MTIFHVLKYHLSTPLTLDEIEALPDEVFEKLLKKTHLQGLFSREQFYDYYRYYHLAGGHPFLQSIQNTLNKLLCEYTE